MPPRTLRGELRAARCRVSWLGSPPPGGSVLPRLLFGTPEPYRPPGAWPAPGRARQALRAHAPQDCFETAVLRYCHGLAVGTRNVEQFRNNGIRAVSPWTGRLTRQRQRGLDRRLAARAGSPPVHCTARRLRRAPSSSGRHESIRRHPASARGRRRGLPKSAPRREFTPPVPIDDFGASYAFRLVLAPLGRPAPGAGRPHGSGRNRKRA